jgi:hypothetical protein
MEYLNPHRKVTTPCSYATWPLSDKVTAKLIEVDLGTGVETVRVTFDSNSFPAADGYHVQKVLDCQQRWDFDFIKKAYFIEATLSHSSLFGGSAAGIQIIKIVYDEFCGP